MEIKRPLEPDWVKNAAIYEVNIRQYTEEGTFKAFRTKHLDRLYQMGVDILWLMPIHPISKKNRKGNLGSYYAVSDFKAINPEFGSGTDLKDLIKEAHEKGMKIILDFVPNHTGWDCPWITENPHWYTQDDQGKVIHPPNTDWTDIADLNYNQEAVRIAVKDAMLYWVKEFDIDGYRVDMAGLVPRDFFDSVRRSLDELKPVFMLAEWEEDPKHFDISFNANYAWTFKNVITEIHRGTKKVAALDHYLECQESLFPRHYFQMYFTTNHDENSWNNYPMLFGTAEWAYTTLAFTWSGMPLIYSGQETGLKKALPFFEKEAIEWTTIKYETYFKTLLELKHYNKALWNGLHGGKPIRIDVGIETVYVFKRSKEGDEVLVALNLSAKRIDVQTSNKELRGTWIEVFSRELTVITKNFDLSMKPYAYFVWSNQV